ncbi:MAG TPA: hypothetical protein VGM90_18340 [Kofleriaceae bacterium]|jgi:hypothetical protein
MSRFRALGLLLMSACGDNHNHFFEVASGSDADVRSITVHYIAPLGTANTPTVIFQTLTDSVELVTRLDANGFANARVSTDANVTIAVDHANTRSLYTYMGVHPGDAVEVDDRTASGPLDLRTVTLDAPTSDGATAYLLETPCGDFDVSSSILDPGAGTVPLSLPDCPSPMDLIVRAFGQSTTYLYAPDSPIPDTMQVSLTGGYRSLDPVAFEIVGATDFIVAQVLIGLVGQSRVLVSDQSGVSLTLTTNGSINTSRPPGATQYREATLLAPFAVSRLHVVEWGDSTARWVVDAGASSPAALLSAPIYDAQEHAIVWNEAQGATSDAVLVTFGWADETTNFQWTVLAPREDGTKLTLPRLPGPELTPNGSLVQPFVFATISTDSGYRAVGTRLLGSWRPGLPWPLEEPFGRVRYRDLDATFVR